MIQIFCMAPNMMIRSKSWICVCIHCACLFIAGFVLLRPSFLDLSTARVAWQLDSECAKVAHLSCRPHACCRRRARANMCIHKVYQFRVRSCHLHLRSNKCWIVYAFEWCNRLKIIRCLCRHCCSFLVCGTIDKKRLRQQCPLMLLLWPDVNKFNRTYVYFYYAFMGIALWLRCCWIIIFEEKFSIRK